LNELKTFTTSARILKPLQHAVIPGFYGIMPNGSIKTFTRGGSDTTGSIIARAINADLYEKWTDKAEIFCADPNIVKSPMTIENITYKELHELSYMGFTVLNEDSVFPINKAGIPVNIRDIHNLDDKGTLILPELSEDSPRDNTFVCVAGKRGFRVLHIEKYKMNRETQFAAKLFNIFARYNIACEHCLSGIDIVSLVLKNPLFDLRRSEIISEIKRELNPENVEVKTNMSLISVIGQGMGTVKGVFAKVFNALANAGVKVKMIDQGSDDLNIILGVDDEDYERSIRALYNALILKNA
ncbi:MAG: ACT domain-containing protein, partial [Synergistaceae bacterium]|nr:ACT domain-containing protein [Synergistaceae bacterium]